MTTELKPCPICGGTPLRNGRPGAGGVICVRKNPSHRLQTYGATQAAAITAWNTRTPTKAPDHG